MKAVKIILINLLLISCGAGNGEKKDSKIYSYYENGQTKISVDTLNGLFHGILSQFYPNGKIKSTQSWQNGAPSGEFIFYGVDGDTVFSEHYSLKPYSYKKNKGLDSAFSVVYDQGLIDFYSKNFKIMPDTSYHIGINNFITVKNVPNRLIAFASNNGLVRPYADGWVSLIKTAERNLLLTCYILDNSEYSTLFQIERIVQSRR